MKYTSLLTVIILFSLMANAQLGNISGKITDSTGKKLLPLTTITVFKAKDTTIITYRLSNENGEFKIPGLPFDVPLRLMATYSGYEAFRKDFVLTAAQPFVGFGTVKLSSSSKQLDEVIVIAERPPVVIKQDTIEFNASAFKTLPNALVEDLLKKLPGVQIDENGDITVNGQKVNRILVDGKRFFGDDPKMATKNLPSNFIDKIQVVDDKDQIAQNNDGDMSTIGKVINLTLKKGVKKGWFGKLYGGGGTDDRYEGGGIANVYRDTLQVSLVGFSNNVNRSGFSMKDISQLGGFDRSGINSISISTGGGREGIAVNGINFGGIGNGVTTTTGIGLNLNHAPTKNLSFFGQYFYGYSNNDVQQVSNNERFISDTSINTRTNTSSINIGHSHTASVGGNWRPDSLSNINFKVAYSHTDNNINSPSNTTIDNSKLGSLSYANGTLYSKAYFNDISESFSISHRFKGKRVRNLSLNENLYHSNNPNYNTTESLNQYYYPLNSSQVFNQLRSTRSPSTTLSANAAYSDVLSKKITLRINSRLEYSNQDQDVFTYGKTAGTQQYDSLNYTLSNSLYREQTRWNNNAGIGYKIKKVTINVTLSWLQQWINNSFGVGSFINSSQYYSNFLPNISVNWKRFNFSFSQDVNAPYIGYMTPVPDNSNPFNIIYGNPNLQPSKRTGVSANGSIYNVKSNLNFNIFANASVTDNAVVQNVIINSNGIQTNTPVNVNGVYSSFINLSANKQYKSKQRFIFTVDARFNGGINRGPIFFNNVQSTTTSVSMSPSLGLSFNWHDVVEFSPRYAPYFSKYYYSNTDFPTTDVVTNNVTGEFIVRMPKKIVWESNITYRYNNQVAPGLPKDNVYWNAAISLLMLKEDKGQLKLAVYDILNRNNGYYRYINANAISESRYNVLQRYVSLTFTYNVRALGAQKQKVGGKQNLFLF
jgi:hypothetical protein